MWFDRARAIRASLIKQPLLGILLLALAVHLPLALSVVQIDFDTAEYVDAARHLATGQGYTLGVRNYLFGEPGVVHDALEGRAPLYPFLIAPLLMLGATLPGLQALNLLLGCGCAVLVAVIASRLFCRPTGLICAFLVAVSPLMTLFLFPVMTEAVTYALLLGALALFLRFLDAPRPDAFALAGAALGLAYLGRPVVGLLSVVMLLGIVLASRQRRALVRPLLATSLGVALFVVPMTAYSFVTHGSLAYTGQGAFYRVRIDRDVLDEATLKPLPTVSEFIADNQKYILRAIGRNLRFYLETLFLDARWLLPFCVVWPLVLIKLLRGGYSRLAWPVLLVAAANFVVHVLTWSFYLARYQTLTALLLLPFAVDGLVSLRLGQVQLLRSRLTLLHLAVLGVALSWVPFFLDCYRGYYLRDGELVGTQTYRDLRWTGPSHWVADQDLEELLDWVRDHTPVDAIVAKEEPHPIALFAGRPAIRIPNAIAPDSFLDFLTDYGVQYVMIQRDRLAWRRYGDRLLRLRDDGVAIDTVGKYWIFDLRSLHA